MVAPLGARLSAAAVRSTTPWRNGGGATAEIARSPETGDAFDWRVSIATISQDGAFSSFPGVDRWLMPLSPAGLVLDGVGVLRRFEVGHFAGETPVAATDVTTPGLDLNLMLDRATTTGSLRHVVIDEQYLVASDETTVVVLLAGALQWDGGMLALHDALILDPGASTALIGTGAVAIAEIRRLP